LVETKYAFGDQPLQPGDTLADIDLGLCDPLTGPLFVQGAEPGDTIAVHIHHVEPTGTAAQGVIPGIGLLEWPTLPAAFPDAALHADLNWPTPYLVAAAAAPPNAPPPASPQPHQRTLAEIDAAVAKLIREETQRRFPMAQRIVREEAHR